MKRAEQAGVLAAFWLVFASPGAAVSAIYSSVSMSNLAPGVSVANVTAHGGMAVADLNMDGLLDIVLGNDTVKLPQVLKNRGYNSATGIYDFAEVVGALPPPSGSGSSIAPSGVVVVGDYDNDGDLDLFFTHEANSNALWVWRNELVAPSGAAPFKFVQVSAELGLGSVSIPLVGISLADVDVDGDLDILVDSTAGTKRLYLNRRETGSMVFQAATSAAISDSVQPGYDVGFFDLNLDGYSDCFSRSSSTSNSLDVLFVNKGSAQPGTFQDAVSAGIASFDAIPGLIQVNIDVSTAVADYDNSGTWDLVFQNRNASSGGTTYKTRFFVGSWASGAMPAFTFSNQNGSEGVGTEVASTAETDFGGGVAFGDMDNDGLVDLYVGSPSSTNSDKVYKNLGATISGRPYQLADLTGETAVTSGTSGDTEAVALADWDNDGDLDLYVNNGGSAATSDAAFLNNTIQPASANAVKNFLRVQVTCQNRDCIGAVVQLYRAGDFNNDRFPDAFQGGYSSLSPSPFQTLTNATVAGTLVGMRQVSGGAGVGAQEPLLLHFGLPATLKNADGSTTSAGADGLYTLRVIFPGGKVLLRDVQPSASSGLWHGLTLSQFVRVDSNDSAEDGDGLPAALESTLGTRNTDLDSDDDGLLDSTEYLKLKTDPLKQDSDNDGLPDGLELGMTTGIADPDGSGPLVATDVVKFSADADPSTRTSPTLRDSDTDGYSDGLEDVNLNGRYDFLNSTAEVETDPLDMDSDEDGIFDGAELNGFAWTDGTTFLTYYSNPRAPDSDLDGVLDCTEVGLTKSMDLKVYKDPASFPLVEGVRVLGTDLSAGFFVRDEDPSTSTNPGYDDSDSDGLSDGYEDSNHNGIYEEDLDETDPSSARTDGMCDTDGEELTNGTDPRNPNDDTCADPDMDLCNNQEEEVLGTDPFDADTDNDYIPDCLEGQLVKDSSPVCPDPIDPDSDDDGLLDGVEDHNQNGSIDANDTNPCWNDTDNDGVRDGTEDSNKNGGVDSGESNPLDSDSDDDGLVDGSEDKNGNGTWESWFRDGDKYGETRSADWDTDDDGLSDGLELGLGIAEDSSTNQGSGHWFADSDRTTTTDPNLADTDSDGLLDGEEDVNRNGKVDGGSHAESDPLKPDTDGDGCSDGMEVTEMNTSPTSKDTDQDGIEDCTENSIGTNPNSADSDGDGLSDGAELTPAPGTSVTDPKDPDSDDDGLSDGTEINGFPYGTEVVHTDPNSSDTDGDGLLDGDEVASSNEEPTNPAKVDTDGDGLDDFLETQPLCLMEADNPDTDGDGFPDNQEDSNLNCILESGETSAVDDDSDDDGLVDGNELKVNKDGTLAPTITGETSTDPLDPDSDDDGLLDGLEVGLAAPQGLGTDPSKFMADSDPQSKTNPLLADTDGDGLHDADEDSNHNGQVDVSGSQPETDPTLFDTDGGCQGDGEELRNSLNPRDPLDDACADPDNDFLTNQIERLLSHTNPLDGDSDDDGIRDGLEPCWTDSDGDGKPDAFDDDGDGTSGSTEKGDPDADGLACPLDADSDNDGILDGTELGLTRADIEPQLIGDVPTTGLQMGAFVADADPATRTNPLRADSNGDGQDDGANDPNHNGKIEGDLGELELAPKTATLLPGQTQDCFAGTVFVDTDCDGLTDAEEEAFNGIRVVLALDPADADSDDDGILDGAEHNWSLDTDLDGLINARDPDSDDDGILDATELGLTTAPASTRTNRGFFRPDADPTTRTSAINRDSDFGGQWDGAEDSDYDGLQGVRSAGGEPEVKETDPLSADDDMPQGGQGGAGCFPGTVFQDQDCDHLTDLQEAQLQSNPTDDDSDDDGMLDGREHNHSLDMDEDGLRGLLDPDADNDLLPDGLESGLVEPQGTGTSEGAMNFIADQDTNTRTSPVCADTDGGSLLDGNEDVNSNGKQDLDELNPLDLQDDCGDQDGDGVESCVPPDQVPDCNDLDANVFPAAQERCDGTDNNCDGQVDEGLSFASFYPDTDSDGYGATSGAVSSCAQTMEGYASDSSDCNDQDASVHPGAADPSYDGIDQDCSGDSDTPTPTQPPTDPPATDTPEPECSEENPCACRCDVRPGEMPRFPLGLLLVVLPVVGLRRRRPAA